MILVTLGQQAEAAPLHELLPQEALPWGGASANNLTPALQLQVFGRAFERQTAAASVNQEARLVGRGCGEPRSCGQGRGWPAGVSSLPVQAGARAPNLSTAGSGQSPCRLQKLTLGSCTPTGAGQWSTGQLLRSPQRLQLPAVPPTQSPTPMHFRPTHLRRQAAASSLRSLQPLS